MNRPVDRDDVDQLVVEHLPAALRVARRLCGDADEAEEIVQEALCRVLRKWRSFRGQSSFRTWMLQIVVNISRDRGRARKTTNSLPLEGAASRDGGPVEGAAARELSERIRTEVDRLPPRQREVALLCLGEGLGAAEVAEVLRISVANVHASLHLARQRIADAIGVDHAGKERS